MQPTIIFFLPLIKLSGNEDSSFLEIYNFLFQLDTRYQDLDQELIAYLQSHPYEHLMILMMQYLDTAERIRFSVKLVNLVILTVYTRFNIIIILIVKAI